MGQDHRGADGPRGGRAEATVDRFDRLPKSGRVGVHRIVARPRRVWQYLLAGIVGTAVLVAAGILGVHSIGVEVAAGGAVAPPGGGAPPSDTAQLDPTATVAVLNGTASESLAAELDRVITGRELGEVRYAGNAEQRDIAISAVFYEAEEDAAAAAGLAAQLGGLSTYQTENYSGYGVRLVVLLGGDYAGPGATGAAEAGAASGAPSGP